MISAAIFDFDGTLTPLTLDFAYLRVKVEELARQYVDDALIAAQAHLYIIETIHAIGDALGHRGQEFQEKAFRLLCDLEVKAARGKDLYPCARDVLTRLKAAGIGVAIITRTCADVIETVFPDLWDYVDVVVTRDDTRHVKPNPEHVHMALTRLGVAPAQAVLAGDHPTDIEAGKASGTITAGVLTGRTGREQFTEAGADYVFEDIRGILKLMGYRS